MYLNSFHIKALLHLIQLISPDEILKLSCRLQKFIDRSMAQQRPFGLTRISRICLFDELTTLGCIKRLILNRGFLIMLE